VDISWEKANLKQHRQVLMTMLVAVYVDCKDEKRIVGIKVKPPFKLIFDLADTREGTGITLWNDASIGKASEVPPNATESNSCF
jgi:site-specific DNA recombinase